ncbi:YajQ family cyclic di-GMP-binding protein [Sulfurospirillum cavolei]|uniref:YajQ family cyclic di-GMP-binding protein n=1 Tax=Sulfurospirillum cavolei TaxID=366522 RepID=UPI000764A6DB|nr:YajQ family cyclic di-GMP-binding protein [Sulfurospirillum cavolei]
MAKEHSFDITAEIDKQKLKDAYEQAKKVITNRWDFKGITCEFDYNEKNKAFTLITTSDNKADAMVDALISEAIKRDISAKALKESKREPSSGGNTKVTVAIVDAISSDDAKKIVKEIKELKVKVQASIRGDVVRVEGKSIDDLQEAIKAIRACDFDFPVNFTNLK